MEESDRQGCLERQGDACASNFNCFDVMCKISTIALFMLLVAARVCGSVASDAGLVVIPQPKGNVLSWRLLAGHPSDTGFLIWRDGVTLTPSPLTQATFYSDPEGTPRSAYQVQPVSGSKTGTLTRSVLPWKETVLRIPLQTPDGYTPCEGSVGDLDGDGVYDLVIKQEKFPRESTKPVGDGTTKLEAYTLQGKLLWRIDLGPNIREGAHYTPFMVYDLDNDGIAEIAVRTSDGTIDGRGVVIGDPKANHRSKEGRIVSGPEFLSVFSGRTGGELARVPYIARGSIKDWGDDYGNRSDRFLMGVGCFDGRNTSVLMCRGYYTRIVIEAYNLNQNKMKLLWSFDTRTSPELKSYEGQGNHSFAVVDVNGDGRDEIIYGSLTLSSEGKPLYCSGLGHGDAMHVGKFDPELPGLQIWQAHEANKAGADFRDAKSGKQLWKLKGYGDVGRALCADIDPRYPGSECWGLGCEKGLYSCKGEKITDVTPQSCNFAIWWDGDLLRELLDRGAVGKWNWEKASMDRLVTGWKFGGDSCNGTKATPVLSADLLGDWREEFILRASDNQSLLLFSTALPTPYRFVTLMQDHTYRMGVALQNIGYNQPPHVGFYLGEPKERVGTK